jgi:hypothetical protein
MKRKTEELIYFEVISWPSMRKITVTHSGYPLPYPRFETSTSQIHFRQVITEVT